MEINKFIEHFAYQFDETSVENFQPSTNFRELEEWSSLMALAIMGMVDEEYDVSLSGTEMRSANTIEELFALVKSKKGE